MLGKIWALETPHFILSPHENSPRYNIRFNMKWSCHFYCIFTEIGAFFTEGTLTFYRATILNHSDFYPQTKNKCEAFKVFLYDNFRLARVVFPQSCYLFLSTVPDWTGLDWMFLYISYLDQVCSISSLCWFAVTQKAPVSAAIFQLFFFLTQKLFQPSKAGREKQIIYGRERERERERAQTRADLTEYWVVTVTEQYV